MRRGGGGGGNAAYLVAGLFVVGIIVVLIVVMSGGKKPKPAPRVEAPVEAPATPVPVAAPAEAAPPPFPPVDPKVLEQARAVARKTVEPGERAKVLWDEAMAARKAGNDDLWQKKLLEAEELLIGVQDEWNEVVQQMPSSKDYDEEEVANHYLGKEGQQVSKVLTLLANVKKTLRLPGD